MTIQYASDLHLEFSENESFISNNPLLPMADTLVLAGDICLLKDLKEHAWFFDYLSANFKTTYWIPGNHEYYHFDFNRHPAAFKQVVRDNVFLVNNFAVTIGNVQLIFSTLWTHIRERNQIAIEKRMNDFRLIRYAGEPLKAKFLNWEHQSCLDSIKHYFSKTPPDFKKVVVTHHVPTYLNYPEQYFGDILNEAFAVELKDLIRDFQPDFWIYGHHHQNIPDFKIGNTKLITNQLGYVRQDEHTFFDPSKFIEV